MRSCRRAQDRLGIVSDVVNFGFVTAHLQGGIDTSDANHKLSKSGLLLGRRSIGRSRYHVASNGYTVTALAVGELPAIA